jgi:hypothetical protein
VRRIRRTNSVLRPVSTVDGQLPSQSPHYWKPHPQTACWCPQVAVDCQSTSHRVARDVHVSVVALGLRVGVGHLKGGVADHHNLIAILGGGRQGEACAVGRGVIGPVNQPHTVVEHMHKLGVYAKPVRLVVVVVIENTFLRSAPGVTTAAFVPMYPAIYQAPCITCAAASASA